MNAPVLTISVPPSTRSLRFVLQRRPGSSRPARRAHHPACRSPTTRSGAGSPTRRTGCRPERGSRRESPGKVEMSLPASAAAFANSVPVSCMPSPESPAKRMTTRSRLLRFHLATSTDRRRATRGPYQPVRRNPRSIEPPPLDLSVRRFRGLSFRARLPRASPRSHRLPSRVRAACAPAASTTPKAPPVASDHFAVGPPLVTPGEHMSYRLALQGMELATYDFAVGECHRGGRQAGDRRAEPCEGRRARDLVAAKSTTLHARGSTSRPGDRCGGPADEFATKGYRTRSARDARFFERQGDRCRSTSTSTTDRPRPSRRQVSTPGRVGLQRVPGRAAELGRAAGHDADRRGLRSRYMWHVE